MSLESMILIVLMWIVMILMCGLMCIFIVIGFIILILKIFESIVISIFMV